MGTYSDGEKNKMLDAWAGRTTYTANAAVYAKLHIGSPGAAGTTNAAAETTRQAVTFGSAAASGAISNGSGRWGGCGGGRSGRTVS